MSAVGRNFKRSHASANAAGDGHGFGRRISDTGWCCAPAEVFPWDRVPASGPAGPAGRNSTKSAETKRDPGASAGPRSGLTTVAKHAAPWLVTGASNAGRGTPQLGRTGVHRQDVGNHIADNVPTIAGGSSELSEATCADQRTKSAAAPTVPNSAVSNMVPCGP